MTTKFNEHLKYEQLHNVVKEINSANLSWKADVHSEFKGMNFVELRKSLGMRGNPNERFTNNYHGLLSTPAEPMTTNFLQTEVNISKMKKTASETTLDMGMDKDLKEFMENLNKEEASIKELEAETETTNNSITESNTVTKTNKTENKLKNTSTVKSTETVETTETASHSDDSNRDKDSSEVTDYSEVSKYINTPLDQIDEKTLPKNWDWRNVGGKSFVPSVKRQGNCGSCYIFSTVTCLESRLRIQTNNEDTTSFSKQYPISCNFYSEGCDGGYPFLVGKFFHEFEVIPEDCFPYTQSNSQCSKVCDYKNKYSKKYTVSQYGYLGGYYGATSEDLMLKELRARGPIPGNIRVPYTFNYYKSGIFSESSLKKNVNRLSKTTMVDRHLSWEKVEHSITIVGYGEEHGVKYWIGMNTWGDNWGENGFFKILRGENDCSIESMGDFIQIQVQDR